MPTYYLSTVLGINQAHVAGAVEVNVTFYLVEAFISMSVQ